MNKKNSNNKITATTNVPAYKSGDIYQNYMGRWSALLITEFIKNLPYKLSGKVLDIGTGTGGLAQAVINETDVSEVIGIDPSSILLDYALKNSLDKNGSDKKLSFIQAYGEALPFRDNAFDAALASLSLHNVPNPVDAVNEMYRVTKPGGLMAACEWDFKQGMQMFRVIWEALAAANPKTTTADTQNTKLGAKGELIELWKASGLTDCKSFCLDIPLTFTSFDDFYQPTLSTVSVTSKTIKSLNASEYAAFKAHLLNRIYGTGETNGPFTLNARAWCVTGTV